MDWGFLLSILEAIIILPRESLLFVSFFPFNWQSHDRAGLSRSLAPLYPHWKIFPNATLSTLILVHEWNLKETHEGLVKVGRCLTSVFSILIIYPNIFRENNQTGKYCLYFRTIEYNERKFKMESTYSRINERSERIKANSTMSRWHNACIFSGI